MLITNIFLQCIYFGWGLGRGVPSWTLCPPPSRSSQGAALWRYNPRCSHFRCYVPFDNLVGGLVVWEGIINSLDVVMPLRWHPALVRCGREELQDSPVLVSLDVENRDPQVRYLLAESNIPDAVSATFLMEFFSARSGW